MGAGINPRRKAYNDTVEHAEQREISSEDIRALAAAVEAHR